MFKFIAPTVVGIFLASNAFSDTTITVPYKKTSSTHFITNLTTEHLAKQVSDVKFKIKNINGGGGLKGATIYANTAQSDGSDMFITSGTIGINYVLKGAEAGYDYGKWKPMFGFSTGGVWVAKPKYKSLDNIMKTKPSFTASGKSSYSMDIIVPLMTKILGWDTKVVWGNGSKGRFKAFMSNETDLDYQTSVSYVKRYAKNPDASIPLFTVGILNEDGSFSRAPDFPNVPHFTEVLNTYGISTDTIEYRAWLIAYKVLFDTKTYMVVPNGTPSKIYSKYVAGYSKALTSNEFLDAFTKKAGFSTIIIGEIAQAKYKQAFDFDDKEALIWLQDYAKSFKK